MNALMSSTALMLFALAAADAKPSERFLAEAPVALAVLEGRLANLECAGAVTTTLGEEVPLFSRLLKPSGRDAGSGLSTRYRDFRLKVRGDSAIVVHGGIENDQGEPTAVRRLIYGVNERESFLLRDLPDGPPMLRRGEAEVPHARSVVEGTRWSYIGALTRGGFGKRTLGEVLAETGFRVNRVEDVERAGRPCVRVEYDRRYEEEGTFQNQAGYFILSPGDLWAFVEFEHVTEPDSRTARGRMRHEVELAEPRDGDLVVRRVAGLVELQAPLSMATGSVFEVERWTYGTIPEREFEPQAYLPAAEAP